MKLYIHHPVKSFQHRFTIPGKPGTAFYRHNIFSIDLKSLTQFLLNKFNRIFINHILSFSWRTLYNSFFRIQLRSYKSVFIRGSPG
jgi:hypothetical protein